MHSQKLCKHLGVAYHAFKDSQFEGILLAVLLVVEEYHSGIGRCFACRIINLLEKRISFLKKKRHCPNVRKDSDNVEVKLRTVMFLPAKMYSPLQNCRDATVHLIAQQYINRNCWDNIANQNSPSD